MILQVKRNWLEQNTTPRQTCYERYKKAGDRSEKETLGMHSHRENFPCDQMTSQKGGTKEKKTSYTWLKKQTMYYIQVD